MARPKGEPKLANCSPSDVFKALKKMGSFVISEGARHVKITHLATGKSSTIPRHKRVNRHLLEDFVDDYLIRDVGLDKDKIYKYLRC